MKKQLDYFPLTRKDMRSFAHRRYGNMKYTTGTGESKSYQARLAISEDLAMSLRDVGEEVSLLYAWITPKKMNLGIEEFTSLLGEQFKKYGISEDPNRFVHLIYNAEESGNLMTGYPLSDATVEEEGRNYIP